MPAFLPDATRAAVRTLDAGDLEACGTPALMVNALHLSTKPGTSLIKHSGGIHRFMDWQAPMASDSGGFQVLSLVGDRSASVSISAKGFSYRSGAARKRRLWTAERCIQQQLSLGADILFCLDHCTHPSEPVPQQQESVDHTIEWARRCREAFDSRTNGSSGDVKPLLFAVIQGGEDPARRSRCAEALFDIGFDGYGYGGWPIDEAGGLVDSVGTVARLVPEGVPKHALGVGKPENVVLAARMCYDTFDCVLPTRDARRGRLFTSIGDLTAVALSGRDFYRYIYLSDERHARDTRPVDDGCPCLCCRRYSRAYLHHLFITGEAVGQRLATIHNLTFYNRLMARLQDDRGAGGSAP